MSDPIVPPTPTPPAYAPATAATPPPAYVPPAYVPPAYAPPSGAVSAPPAFGPPTNSLAIVAIILGFLVPLGGIICGHISLSQIKRTGEGGRGLALTGLIVGYAFTAFAILYFVVIFGIVIAAGAGSTYGGY